MPPLTSRVWFRGALQAAAFTLLIALVAAVARGGLAALAAPQLWLVGLSTGVVMGAVWGFALWVNEEKASNDPAA